MEPIQNKNKVFWFICFICAVFIIALGFYIKNPKDLAILTQSESAKKISINSDDPILGNKYAKITIVEFADFGCTYCKNESQIMKDIIKEYGDLVRIVWKDVPLTKIPAQSKTAHIAAYCAKEQDLFWEYHDILFQNQDVWPTKQNFSELASNIPKIKIDTFEKCLKNPTDIIEHLQKNLITAGEQTVDSVPYFIINDKIRITGLPNLAVFKRQIDALNKE